jgi:Phytanoyl-CoA dioxygenase (PhyH)
VVLDGSHHWSHLIDRSALSFHQRDMAALERYITSAGYEFKPVVMQLKRGQFSLHHCRTIHGSFANRSASPRIALAVHMQDGENRYRPAFKPDGRPIQLYNDTICARTSSGLPDYGDQRVFPVLWNSAPGRKAERGVFDDIG